MTKPRIAIITGVGRLQGIGKAICTELAKKGIDIFFTYWHQYDKQMSWIVEDNEPDKIQEEIRDLGVRCEKLELDLTDSNSANILIDTACKTLGRPTILINNATYSTQTTLHNITSSELDAHYHVNLKAPILLTTKFIEQLNEEDKGGRIVNISSGQSLSFMSDEIAYAVTKGAIETFTRTISQELAKKKVTINAVNPGLTDTGWLTEEQEKQFSDRFPMGRTGQPSDATKLIAFLVSDEAEWITGQVIHSEGGFIREKY